MGKYLDKEGVKRVWNDAKQLIEDELYEQNIDTNGYDFVDMGEAGIWATCNVGASKPEEYGLYFAWGETKGYPDVSGDKKFDKNDYELSDGDAQYSSNLIKYNKTDNLTILELEDDAAHVNMGGDWRMPTNDEFQKLIDLCNAELIDNYNDTGIKGMLFKLKTNESKQLFFPYGGSYYYGSRNGFTNTCKCWSSVIYGTTQAYCLSFNKSAFGIDGRFDRWYGYNVRGYISTKSNFKSPKYLTKQDGDKRYAGTFLITLEDLGFSQNMNDLQVAIMNNPNYLIHPSIPVKARILQKIADALDIGNTLIYLKLKVNTSGSVNSTVLVSDITNIGGSTPGANIFFNFRYGNYIYSMSLNRPSPSKVEEDGEYDSTNFILRITSVIPEISNNLFKEWYGTQAQYDALGTYDENTKYYILED